MKRKDIWLLLGVLAVAAVIFLLTKVLPGSSGNPSGGELPLATATAAPTVTDVSTATAASTSAVAPTATATNAPAAGTASTATIAPTAQATATPDAGTQPPAAAATLVPAQAYLSVQIDNIVFDPYPLLEDRDLELPQPGGKLNVVRVTKDSIMMHSSTCDNQDCVHQGIVTLENRDTRILSNAIVCLPNKVILLLLTPEEAQREWQRYYAPQ
ncbi:MAG: NusG domain II-containing protein [Christensenellales bacterium]